MPRRLRDAALLGLAAGAAMLMQDARAAEALQDQRAIGIGLAIEAARAAVEHCAVQGYRVSAAVVEPDGQLKAFAKGDGAPPHTRDSAIGKAYTAATLGPVAGMETSGEIQALIQTHPDAAPLANLPGLLPLRGGIVIKAGGEVVGAIGVGGAPGGDKDEACARAGLAKIKDRLPQ